MIVVSIVMPQKVLAESGGTPPVPCDSAGVVHRAKMMPPKSRAARRRPIFKGNDIDVLKMSLGKASTNGRNLPRDRSPC